jgi:uncharacterized protein
VSDEALTPCVQICVIHSETGICAGCFRTRAEIAAWGGLDNAARREIMATLPDRAGLLTQRRGGRTGRLGRGRG